MARVTEQFRPGDVSFWGLMALALWGVAIGSASLSAVVPDGIIGWLHASRAQGGTLTQLQGDVAGMSARLAQVSQFNTSLQEQLSRGNEMTQDLMRRVTGLEVSVPNLVEAVNAAQGVDGSVVTGAIPAPATTSVAVPGGSVSYSTAPLTRSVPTIAVKAPASAGEQPMPTPLVADVTPDANAFGVALGPPIEAQDGALAWAAMREKVGTLLLGLGPVLARIEGGPGRKLVAGPLATEADAQEICGRMARVGIACSVSPFVGDVLAVSPTTNP